MFKCLLFLLCMYTAVNCYLELPPQNVRHRVDPYPYGRDLGDYVAIFGDAKLKIELKDGAKIQYFGKWYPHVHAVGSGYLIFTDSDTISGVEKWSSKYNKEKWEKHDMIAVYWTELRSARYSEDKGEIFYRLTSDPDLMKRLASEVIPVYGERTDFSIKWALIVTWRDMRHAHHIRDKIARFQMAFFADDKDITYAIYTYNRLDFSGPREPSQRYDNGTGYDFARMGVSRVKDLNTGAHNEWLHPDSGTENIMSVMDGTNYCPPGRYIFRFQDSIEFMQQHKTMPAIQLKRHVWIVSVKTGIKGTHENVEIQLNGFGGDGGIQILTSPVDDHQSQGLVYYAYNATRDIGEVASVSARTDDSSVSIREVIVGNMRTGQYWVCNNQGYVTDVGNFMTKIGCRERIHNVQCNPPQKQAFLLYIKTTWVNGLNDGYLNIQLWSEGNTTGTLKVHLSSKLPWTWKKNSVYVATINPSQYNRQLPVHIHKIDSIRAKYTRRSGVEGRFGVGEITVVPIDVCPLGHQHSCYWSTCKFAEALHATRLITANCKNLNKVEWID